MYLSEQRKKQQQHQQVQSEQVAVPPSTRPYKTRERLYYETNYINATSSSTSATTKQSLFEPFAKVGEESKTAVSTLNAEELPPVLSQHEYFLSPDRKHIGELPEFTSTSNTTTSFVSNGVFGSPKKGISSSLRTNAILTFDQGSGSNSSTGITVFGFPSTSLAAIIQSFQAQGHVIDYTYENGNWVHIVYEDEVSAQKALMRHAQIMPGGFMIGVVPMQKAVDELSLASESFLSPVKRPELRSPSISVPSGQPAKLESIYKVKKNVDLPAADAATLPSESSLLTRIVNYIFGW